MRSAGDLGKAVLRDVSRSFYLSLRFLPGGFREPASLGYLLARLSDTVADAGGLERGERRELLERMSRFIRGESNYGSGALSTDLAAVADQENLTVGEAVLMRRSAEVFAWLESQPGMVRDLLDEVLTTIISGQSWDLDRFAGDGVVRLADDGELEDYTYRVAGCVGEFWTRLGFLCDEHFAEAAPKVMEEWGRSYGQGLQLVNILRDVAEDWERGRCYIPGSGEETVDVLRDSARWRVDATGRLENALAYCESVRARRLAFASGLPALLGLLTLRKLERASWEDLRGTVKVSRREVRRAGFLAMQASVAEAPDRWRAAWRRLSEISEA